MGIKSMLLALRRAWAGDPAIPPGASIGKDVYIGPGVMLDWAFGHLVTIQDDATIVSGTRILCHDAASNRRHGVTWCAPVAVGRRAYIGAVVTKDVAPGAVVAGVPASTISNIVELDGRRRALLETREVFGPEFIGRHLSPRRIVVLRAAGLEGGYFLRSAAPPSARDDVSQATVDPKGWS